MKKLLLLKALIVVSGLILGLNLSFGQFSNDNLAILVAAASANNTTVSVVEINKTSEGQTAIQTIPIPGTGTDAIRVSGSATSTLYAANSYDGTLFCFTGHLSEVTGSNANTLLTRAVVTINNAGTINIAATYTGASGNQTRCATTYDNVNFYIADQGGQFTNGATSASPSANLRGAKTFGGDVYFGRASGTAGTIEVVINSALAGGTLVGLPGLSNHANHQDFYLISSGSNGSEFDVLYILRATSNTVGTIEKYSLAGGNWVSNGFITTTYGGFSLLGEKSGSGAVLYLSTGQGALAANSVRKLTDAAGYNQTIDITQDIILHTAASGTIIKGVAFAPKSTPVHVPTKLAVTSVNDGAEVVRNEPFSLKVQAQFAVGQPGPVVSGTIIDLTRATGTGVLGGTLQGTIPTGASTVTISGITYNVAESGVSITASATGLTPATSALFDVNVPSSAEKLASGSIRLYPNPASSKIVITDLEAGTGISIYNVAGELKMRTRAVGSHDEIDVTSLPAGIYFVRTDGGPGSVPGSARVMITR